MSDVTIQRLRNEVNLSKENEESGFGQDILLICNVCEQLSAEGNHLKTALQDMIDNAQYETQGLF